MNRKIKIPGILIEAGFLSNENDRYLLRQADYQYKICNSIKSGLIKFFYRQDIREKLTKFIKNYYTYSWNEYKLLYKIKRSNDVNEDEIVDILEELENIFNRNFETIESVLIGYTDAVFYHDDIYTSFCNKEFNINYLECKIKKLIKNKRIY